MLHRAVMTMVLGRQLGRDEFVCHRDDDVRNNWPENLYLGDRQSNAADCLRNGRHVRGYNHPCTETWMLRFARYGEPWLVESGGGPRRFPRRA